MNHNEKLRKETIEMLERLFPNSKLVVLTEMSGCYDWFWYIYVNLSENAPTEYITELKRHDYYPNKASCEYGIYNNSQDYTRIEVKRLKPFLRYSLGDTVCSTLNAVETLLESDKRDRKKALRRLLRIIE